MKRILLALLAANFFIAAAFADGPTNSSTKIIARIALLSDPHVNRATNGMDATFKPHFEKTIADVNAAKVDFVLIAGDLTQDAKIEEMEDFKNHIKKFNGPVWFVPGNHDVGHKFNSGKAAGTVTPEDVAFYEKNLGPAFFAHKKSGVRVIGITSSILGSGFEREKEMWSFLEKELAKPSPSPTILFMHYPLFVGSADEPGGVYWNIEPEPRQRLLKLIKQAGVKTFLSGHLHRQLVNHNDGILFFSTAPISFGLPREKQPEGWTLVTVPKSGEAQCEFQTIK